MSEETTGASLGDGQQPEYTPPATLTDTTGRTYTVGEQLGSGTQAKVHVVTDETGDRFASKFFTGPSELDYFKKREIKVHKGLLHPNILTVVGVGDEIPALILELGDTNLAEKIGETGMSMGDALHPLLDALRALRYLARRGIVHRDIKPANIVQVVTESGETTWKLGDFGLVLPRRATPLETKGTVVGSPPYLSPESLQGKRQTPATDIYAAGITAFKLLTGRSPYEVDGSVESLIEAHIGATPLFLPDVLSDGRPSVVAMGEAIRAALGKDPQARPTAKDFAHKLAKAASLDPQSVHVEVRGLHEKAQVTEIKEELGQEVSVIDEREGRVLSRGPRSPGYNPEGDEHTKSSPQARPPDNRPGRRHARKRRRVVAGVLAATAALSLGLGSIAKGVSGLFTGGSGDKKTYFALQDPVVSNSQDNDKPKHVVSPTQSTPPSEHTNPHARRQTAHPSTHPSETPSASQSSSRDIVVATTPIAGIPSVAPSSEVSQAPEPSAPPVPSETASPVIQESSTPSTPENPPPAESSPPANPGSSDTGSAGGTTETSGGGSTPAETPPPVTPPENSTLAVGATPSATSNTT